jgi:choline dehydrogenase-like flavoprotein
MARPRRPAGSVPGDREPRFPGFDVLAHVDAWDPVTAGVVLARLGPRQPLRFFPEPVEAGARALFDLLLDQHAEPRVPVFEMVDQRLAELATDGWHYADLPPDPDAWLRSLAALEEDAHCTQGRPFALCTVESQGTLLQAVLDLGDQAWHGMRADRVWSLWSRYACAAFFSHPWAWNEVGFPGPAYPRGYKDTGVNRREPFEVPDRQQPEPVHRDQPAPRPAQAAPRPAPPRRPLLRDGSADAVRARNASAWLLPAGQERTDHRLREQMRRYADTDELDAVIVGCGAGGATMAQRLARAGWRVAALEAGPFWDPDQDWVSDEAGSHHLYWTEPRVITGGDPVPLGSNNSGRGVGGSMVHFAGYTPRFHPSDFATFSRDGVGADWPIDYHDLRPYYELLEGELPVAGEAWPWGEPHTYPHAPHPIGGNGEIFQRGADACGIETRVGPVAIANGRFGHRQHCIYRGFCLQGCKVNAKASPLITHVPDALAHGAEIRPDSMVTRIEVDERTGRATGVRYLRGGVEHFQRAAVVVVAGYSIETPRLLLNSTSRRFPDGLCNDHDLVGRYLMVQGAPQTGGRFADEVRMYKAPPPEVSTEQFYETDPAKPYRRGFSVQCVSPLPITWSEHFAGQNIWGRDLREQMSDYVHWACLGALCEFLPLPENRVALADQTDRHGIPVAQFSYTQCDNDRALMSAATAVMEQILGAAGAERVTTFQRFAHLVGGARMGPDETSGVVDADCRSFAVPNLLITDGSVLPTQGAANPALTIMAVAARAADRLVRATPG